MTHPTSPTEPGTTEPETRAPGTIVPGTTALTATGVNVRYRNRPILSDVSVAFGPGIHGVVGRNGVGKTTLLRVLAGHLRPAAGSVERPAAGERRGTAIARVAADVRYAGATVGKHLRVAAIGHPALDRELALAIVDDAGVTASTRTKILSAGQRQLLSAATALASGAAAILLDEPFTGLDVERRLALRDRIIAVAAERPDLCLILTSHRSEDLAGLVDDVTVIHRGTEGPDHARVHGTDVPNHARDRNTDGARVTGPIPLDDARPRYPVLQGPTAAVDAIAGDATRIRAKSLGAISEITLGRPLTQSAMRRAGTENITVSMLSDGDLIDVLAMHGHTEGAER